MLVYLKDVFFEALTPCLLLYLSIKVALVIIVTSARSGGEAQASVAHQSHTACVLGRVESRSHPEFLPKLGSELHWNGDVNLSVSFPRPHDSRGFFMTWLLRKVVFFYSEGSALEIIPEITSFTGAYGDGSPLR